MNHKNSTQFLHPACRRLSDLCTPATSGSPEGLAFLLDSAPLMGRKKK